MPNSRPGVSRSSPAAAERCAAGAGLDGDPPGRATIAVRSALRPAALPPHPNAASAPKDSDAWQDAIRHHYHVTQCILCSIWRSTYIRLWARRRRSRGPSSSSCASIDYSSFGRNAVNTRISIAIVYVLVAIAGSDSTWRCRSHVATGFSVTVFKKCRSMLHFRYPSSSPTSMQQRCSERCTLERDRVARISSRMQHCRSRMR